MFLEDGDWKSANEYCEKVLDQDPENAQAYLGKLMAELRVRKQEDLKDCSQPFNEKNNYQKVLRFADKQLQEELEADIAYIKERNKHARLEGLYGDAAELKAQASSKADYQEAAEAFAKIPGYRDADAQKQECLRLAEEARKDAIYRDAEKKAANRRVESQEAAISIFQTIFSWRDAGARIEACQRTIEELKAEQEADRLEQERKAELARQEAKRTAKRNKKIAIITTSIVCAIIAFIIILNAVITAQKKHDFIAAYGQEVYDELGLVEEGAYITFGAYEQDDNASNGKEDVEWLVLEVKDGKALVISKYALDSKPYDTNYTLYNYWETCTLRKWLNNDFINTAFSAKEKAMIPTVMVSAEKNPEYGTNPGKATKDRVFLLSITEAYKYFSSDRARQCQPTDYAGANGAWVDKSGNCEWWLRSPGAGTNFAAKFFTDGDLAEAGENVREDDNAVRPALWINLNA